MSESGDNRNEQLAMKGSFCGWITLGLRWEEGKFGTKNTGDLVLSTFILEERGARYVHIITGLGAEGLVPEHKARFSCSVLLHGSV